MLVEVRVRLEGPLAEIVDRANAAIKGACALFTGLTREQVAVHYHGIHEVPRVKWQDQNSSAVALNVVRIPWSSSAHSNRDIAGTDGVNARLVALVCVGSSQALTDTGCVSEK